VNRECLGGCGTTWSRNDIDVCWKCIKKRNSPPFLIRSGIHKRQDSDGANTAWLCVLMNLIWWLSIYTSFVPEQVYAMCTQCVRTAFSSELQGTKIFQYDKKLWKWAIYLRYPFIWNFFSNVYLNTQDDK